MPKAGTNVEVEIEGNKVTVTFDLSAPMKPPSGGPKRQGGPRPRLIATTHGHYELAPKVTFVLSAYRHL